MEGRRDLLLLHTHMSVRKEEKRQAITPWACEEGGDHRVGVIGPKSGTHNSGEVGCGAREGARCPQLVFEHKT